MSALGVILNEVDVLPPALRRYKVLRREGNGCKDLYDKKEYPKSSSNNRLVKIFFMKKLYYNFVEQLLDKKRNSIRDSVEWI